MNIPQETPFSDMSIQDQREYLQELNPDKLAGVFNMDRGESGNEYNMMCHNHILACYPNQIVDGQIALPDDFAKGGIVIVNMGYDYDNAKVKVPGMKHCTGGLQKGKIEVIAGNPDNVSSSVSHPVLLSPGVIEYQESEKGRKFIQTGLRDGGKTNTSDGIIDLADANERTTTAGRNFLGKLQEDLEIENAEESPFLMQNTGGVYYLVTHDHKKYKSHLKNALQSYLKNKYLSPSDENYEEVKKAFDVKFSGENGIKYENLGQVLSDIIDNDRFESYNWEEGEIDGIEKTTIRLGDEEGEYYVFHDEKNNTIEYRAIRKITGFPKGLKAVGKIPLRIFTESQNQNPSVKKIENMDKYGAGAAKLVPTINDVCNRVNTHLEKQDEENNAKKIGISFKLGSRILIPIISRVDEYQEVSIRIGDITSRFKNPDKQYNSFKVLEKDGKYILEVTYQKWYSDFGSSPYLGKEKKSYFKLEKISE
ncbi:hypothetical protein N9J72_01575 [Candidatus Gracilibacteria bacterium]|nr:hypothetical protein [Candidatus Gracilibacteria bacterium]